MVDGGDGWSLGYFSLCRIFAVHFAVAFRSRISHFAVWSGIFRRLEYCSIKLDSTSHVPACPSPRRLGLDRPEQKKYMSSGSVKLAETVMGQFTCAILGRRVWKEVALPCPAKCYGRIWHVSNNTSESWYFLQSNIGSPWQESGQGFVATPDPLCPQIRRYAAAAFSVTLQEA